MSTYTVLDLEAIKNAVHNGGAAGLTEYLTDDIEFTQTDQRTPPATPACYAGREALMALAEDLERRGIRMEVDDGFIVPTAARSESVCTYPDGNQDVDTRSSRFATARSPAGQASKRGTTRHVLPMRRGRGSQPAQTLPRPRPHPQLPDRHWKNGSPAGAAPPSQPRRFFFRRAKGGAWARSPKIRVAVRKREADASMK